MAAKKAAKAKAAAAKKGKGTATAKSTKGTSAEKEKAAGKSKEAAKPPKAVKGQEAKKDGAARSAPKNKAMTAAKDTQTTTRTMGTNDAGLSDAIAAEMMDSRRENFVTRAEENKKVDKIAEEMMDSRRENFVAKTEERKKMDEIAEEMMDSQWENFVAAAKEAVAQSGEVEEYVAAAKRQWSEAARPEPTAVQPSINELEKLVAAANAASPSASKPPWGRRARTRITFLTWRGTTCTARQTLSSETFGKSIGGKARRATSMALRAWLRRTRRTRRIITRKRRTSCSSAS